MKLVIEAEHKAGVVFDDLEDMTVEVGFLIRGDDIKRLKIGSNFYFYIDDVGDISHVGGIFKDEPTGNEVTNQISFRDAASLVFTLEPKMSELGTISQQEMHRDSMLLRGSRLTPSYLGIKKINVATSPDGDTPYAYVTGKAYKVRDPRLIFLSSEENTRFGAGQFNADNVKALNNGNFIHLVLSPYASLIEKLVDEQTAAFKQYSTLYSDTESDPDDKEIWVSQYEHTRKLLKPHAGEIYKFHNGIVYYINSGGNWQCENLHGLRSLDLDDRIRIKNHLKVEGQYEGDLASHRQGLAKKSFLDSRKLINLAPALQSYIRQNEKDDIDTFDRRKKKLETLRPSDGPLGRNDIAGLKDGVTLFPHQSLLLATLKDRGRLLVDADPGAGKALIIICDILQQMKARRVQRPLVLMPESLLPQFAKEVKDFSELNPWIISTDSIKRWGATGELPEFLEDAKRAPRNTVFLTSYNWISLEPELAANGEISESAGKIDYRASKVFNRPYILMNQLRIDAVFMDECHVLRGSSNMARAAAHFSSIPMVRGLTGTPMPGTPYDITGPMSSIHSSVFGTNDDFMKLYTSGNPNNYHPDAPKRIRANLKEFGVISVRRSAWAHLLPKIYREFHYADFTPEQKKAYSALLTSILDEIRQDPKLSVLLKKVEDALDDGDEITVGPLLSRFTPLDIFLNAPAEAKDWLKSLMVGENAVSPKVKVINEIIKKHLANPEAGKVLVFVQYKESAKNLFNNIDSDLKDQAGYYEGGMNDTLNRFKNPQDPLKILFAVDRSLVVGHNIQAANCIINADLKWLHGDMSQREARAARIGQKRDVYIHNVMVRDSAEILKMAKLISAEHTITKANSDFSDTKTLKPVQMTLQNMQGFTGDHQLRPYLERKKDIDTSIEVQASKEKDFYGPTMMKPHGYNPISSLFREAKTLKKVPSARDFIGDEKSHDDLVAQDLENLPNDPKHPKILTLGIMSWDDNWLLYSYRTADPDGFLRRFGFSLLRGYYYLEVTSKAAVDGAVKKIERWLTISNLPEFEKQVRETRVTNQGVRSGLLKQARKAKIAAAADEADDMEKVEKSPDYIDKSKKGEIALSFGVVDGAPVIWTHDIFSSSSDPELVALRKAGFEMEPAIWKKPITRSQLRLFLSKINEGYPQVRLAHWEDFKTSTHTVFKGLDLSDFDTLAEKKK